MLLSLLLFASTIVPTSAPPEDLVLTREHVDRPFASALGWNVVPRDQVDNEIAWIPNEVLYLLDVTPDSEPLSGQQWQLERLRLGRAFPNSTGNGVVIAVVDSGVDFDHPDLTGRIFENSGETAGNGVDDDGNGYVDDVNGWDFAGSDADPSDSGGHGTAVAATAAASLNNTGIAGIAPHAEILPVRVCGSSQCDIYAVAFGIMYATDMGADVINLSLGNFVEPGILADAVDYAEAAGVLVVAAAGNSGSDIDDVGFLPAGLPNSNLISVAATNPEDGMWTDSNWGRESVDIGAPGVDIVTAGAGSASWVSATGTSFSAPHASGLAALMLEANPALSPQAAIHLMGTLGDPLPGLRDRTSFGTRIRADLATVAAGLTDIYGSIFLADIAWLATENITRGCNPPHNDLFCPQAPVTRGQMAAFLNRALDLAPGPDAFADDDGHQFEADINAIAHADITRGCDPPSNTAFCADQPVTRGQMAGFLKRALGLAPGPDAFADDDGHQFEADIDAIANADVTRGCNPPANDKYCPDATISRGQMAAYLSRALGR